MIPEEGQAPHEPPPREGERDVLAERRARRAWLSSPALARRAEAAEATARTLEAHLADLRRRQVEVERERELASVQLAERELQLRRVKQREYAEQQLRVEAEEAAVRLRRSHRAELDRLQRRAEEAHAAAQHAEEQRDELAARLVGVGESCARLQRGVTALQSVAAGLRTTLERDQQAALARIRELEGELERTLAPAPAATLDPAATPDRGGGVGGLETEPEDVRREELTGALAAAVERLRARAGAVEEQSEPRSGNGRQATEAPAVERPTRSAQTPAPAAEIPIVYVVPRLFTSPARGERPKLGRRLAPAVRRIAARLATWADQT